MKLLTKELQERFKIIGCQEHVNDPIVIAKFFNPVGQQSWFATEYDPQTRRFFGYVSLFGDENDEWGYFSLPELESVKLPLGLSIERDLYFEEKPISEYVPKAVL